MSHSRPSSGGHDSQRIASNRARYSVGSSVNARTNDRSWTDKTGSGGRRGAAMYYKQIKDDLFGANGRLKLGRANRADPMIFITSVALSAFGLVIIYSISSGLYDGDTAVINREMIKRIGFLLMGVAAFLLARRIPLDWWRRNSAWIFLAAFVICLALPVMGELMHLPIATCSLGACRWYNLGILSFQPAELLKIATVLFMAGYLSSRLANGKINSYWTLIEVAIVMLASLLVIVGLQKDMGTGVALLAIYMIQLVMSGVAWSRLGVILAGMLTLFVLMIAVAPHRLERIATFTKSGDADTDYHINQAMIALGSGGVTGRGLGQSVQAYGWLPEAINDSIFAIIGETLGFIGAAALIGVFAYLIFRMFRLTNYLKNMYLRLVVAGVVGWFAAHVLANSMSMIHLIPLTGITLPLVSSGGTSLLFLMAGLGVVSGISRYASRSKISVSEVDERKEIGANENSMRGWRQWGPRDAHSRSSERA